jgi:hypothetical protein
MLLDNVGSSRSFVTGQQQSSTMHNDGHGQRVCFQACRDIWSQMVAGQISGSNMNLGSPGVIGSGINNSGLHGSGALHPAGLGVPTAGDGSTSSSMLSSGSVLDGFAMSMPLGAAIAAQQLLQVMLAFCQMSAHVPA